MTDRELLELAAKAADMGEGTYCELVGGEPALYFAGTSRGIWSPLIDDGDALRLAVKLQIDIRHFNTFVDCEVRDGEIWPAYDDKNGGDRLAATRRAITRAAAAIGEKNG